VVSPELSDPELVDPRSARVKRLRRLSRRASRQESGRFLVEGAQGVREAVASATAGEAVVHEVLVSTSSGARHTETLTAAHGAGIEVTTVSDDVAAALSETVTPQGLLAVVDLLDVPLEVVLADRPALVVVLADVRDPGNAGSVIRAADAAGAAAVVLAGDSVDPHNGKAVRASVGSLFHVRLVTDVTVADAISAFRSAGMAVCVADGSGADDLDRLSASGQLREPTAWVFGNEAWGVPADVRRLADRVVAIPIYGRAESLNLATAATLCLYASARAQRRTTGIS
jgi:TrmH family RNA methyltransferase